MIMDLKVLLAPQFNMDFDDLLQEEPKFEVLDTPELGNFYIVNVTKGIDSDKIRFISPVPIISTELDNFIAFCTAMLGNDAAGHGIIRDTDRTLLEFNCFSRIWDGLLIESFRDEDTDSNELAIEITIKH